MRILRILLVAAAGCGGAAAQNSDLGFLAGVTGPSSDVVVGRTVQVSSSVGVTGQINYAVQVWGTPAGSLYLEFPLAGWGREATVVGSGVSTSRGNSILFTPGVRWKISPQARVSFYGALGGGVGGFGTESVNVSSQSVRITTGRTAVAVLDFAGGLDLRLTRLLSLRGEVRDFVSRAGLGGVAGHHHVAVCAGIAFHF